MRKFLAILCCSAMVFSLCACNQQTDPTTSTETQIDVPESDVNYSIGLLDNGFYENYDELCLKNYEHNLTMTAQEVEEYILTVLYNETGDDTYTFDRYVELYANDLMSSMGIDKKEVVELTDAVAASLVFHDAEGKEMPEYTQTSTVYVVKEDADSIVSSFLTHKIGDTYDTSYTFPDDDEYNPGETVTVTVTIDDIYYSDAINSGVVEAHLTEIGEVLDGVTDAESMKAVLRPFLIGYHLSDCVRERIIDIELDIPEEWLEYEKQRLQYRLQALGMTYEQYLEGYDITHAEAMDICKENTKENIILMAVYKEYFTDITDEELANAYGDQLNYYESVQGRPYIKLRLMRAKALNELAKQTPVLEADGTAIDLSIYFDLTEKTDEENSAIVSEETIPVETEGTNN